MISSEVARPTPRFSAAAFPFARLQVLDDPEPRGAALNMALDEALLETICAEAPADGVPWLRVYRWTRPAVSIGCFARVAEARTRFPGRELVRRWTGGGIVEHGDGLDWTYSLLVPRAHSLAKVQAEESYRSIHSALAAALRTLGQSEIQLAPGRARLAGAGGDPASAPCFDHPVRADVLLAGKKVAGAAQRRCRAGLLHQGSLGGGAVPADDAGRRALTEAFAAALVSGTGAVSWCRGPVEGFALAAGARPRADALVSAKYGSAAWRERR